MLMVTMLGLLTRISQAIGISPALHFLGSAHSGSMEAATFSPPFTARLCLDQDPAKWSIVGWR